MTIICHPLVVSDIIGAGSGCQPRARAASSSLWLNESNCRAMASLAMHPNKRLSRRLHLREIQHSLTNPSRALRSSGCGDLLSLRFGEWAVSPSSRSRKPRED